MNDHYSVSELCEAFDVSRSGYHAWSTRAPSARDQDDAQLAPLIAAAHTEGRREYDSPRVMRWLQKTRASLRPQTHWPVDAATGFVAAKTATLQAGEFDRQQP